MLKNKRIRKAMIDADMRQTDLAELLGVHEATVSRMMSEELARDEQNRIIEMIKTKGGQHEQIETTAI